MPKKRHASTPQDELLRELIEENARLRAESERLRDVGRVLAEQVKALLAARGAPASEKQKRSN